MKKYALPLALATVASLQACNKQPTAPVLESFEQRFSYGIGYNQGVTMKQQQVPVDVDAFASGLHDSLTGAESRMTQEEIEKELRAYGAKRQALEETQREESSAINTTAGKEFLATNASAEGVIVTETGLQYQILEAAEGAKPGAEDTVEVHYRGTLLDGTEFDSSYSRGQTVSFGVGQVIPGWTEALQLMPVGSKWKLFIPSELAYGAGGAGGVIGPNATLIFEVELVAIAAPEAEEAAAK